MRKLQLLLLLMIGCFAMDAQIYTAIADLEEGYTSSTIAYLSTGEDIDAKSKDYTLLNKSIESGHLDVAMQLIEKGADVNLQTNNKAPLVFAAQQGDRALVDALLKAGADMEYAFSEDLRLWQIASRAGHQDLAIYLQTKAVR